MATLSGGEKHRGAIARAGHRDTATVEALGTRLSQTEAAYRDLKAAVDAGAGEVKLAEAHAKALVLLEGNAEALAAYTRIFAGSAGDLGATAGAFAGKCPAGTAPRQKVSSARVAGFGNADNVEFRCEELHSPTVGETASARTTAAFAGRKGLATAEYEGRAALVVAERPALGWRIARDVGLAALGATATYFLVGALSSRESADHNGKVGAAIVGAVGGGITIFEF